MPPLPGRLEWSERSALTRRVVPQRFAPLSLYWDRGVLFLREAERYAPKRPLWKGAPGGAGWGLCFAEGKMYEVNKVFEN